MTSQFISVVSQTTAPPLVKYALAKKIKNKKPHQQQTAKLLLNDSKMLWLLNTSAFLMMGHVLRLCYYCVITDIIQQCSKASLEWRLFTALAVNWGKLGWKKWNPTKQHALILDQCDANSLDQNWIIRVILREMKKINKNAYQTDSEDSDGVHWLIVRILQLDLCVLPSKYHYTHLILMSRNHFKRCSHLEAVAGRRWRPV